MFGLRVDTQEVRAQEQHLRDVIAILQSVSYDAETAVQAVGHPDLEKALRDFGSSWDTRRAKLIERLEGLAIMVRATADVFEDLDEQLAQTASQSSTTSQGSAS